MSEYEIEPTPFSEHAPLMVFKDGKAFAAFWDIGNANDVVSAIIERDRMRSALRVISVWAMNDALDNDHVGRLCDKALGCNDDGEPQ